MYLNTSVLEQTKRFHQKFVDDLMAMKDVYRVLWMALVSRCVTLGLIVVQDALFRDLSTSSHLQYYPCHGGDQFAGQKRSWWLDMMESMIPWDGVYFMRIAQCGYESDQIFAFFPLLPAIMRGSGEVFNMLFRVWFHENAPIEYMRFIFGLTGFFVNLVAFCGAALCLYKLGKLVVKDQAVVGLSVLLFCWNPASVFYSAVYTESLFAFCTWMGLTSILRSPRSYWTGVLWFALASSSRSNGILAVWFLLNTYFTDVLSSKKISLTGFIRTLVGSLIVCIPYVCMQTYGYLSFCRREDTPEWCHATVPLIYGYIQNKYWDVGFLHFYENLIRIPFVVQSLPVIVVSVAACWTWTSAGLQRACSLGLIPLGPEKVLAIRKKMMHSCCITEPRIGAFVYHLALMTAVAALVMHVNVATRFLSSSPLLFWYTAQRMLNGPHMQNYLIWLWFLSYIMVGTLMFSNFYPWT